MDRRINIETEEWRTVPGHQKYEMSNQGRVRNKKSGRPIDPQIANYKIRSGVSYYMYLDNSAKGIKRKADYWFQLVWPDKPMIDFTDAWRDAIVELNDLPKRPRHTYRPRGEFGKRKCHYCGKKTNNFACSDCRKEKISNSGYLGGPYDTYVSGLPGMGR